MSEMEKPIQTPIDHNKGLISSLLDRNLPQLLGLYLAGSWGVIQFVEWAVNRYHFSPYLPDILLLITFSLLPAVSIVVYYHGRRGFDPWQKSEKIGVPVNLIFTLGLLFFTFGDKNLGAATETIVVKNEDGVEIQQVIPTKAFRKKIALFAVKNSTSNVELDGLSTTLPFALAYDLEQDIFITAIHPLHSSRAIRSAAVEAGFDITSTLPFTLQFNIAETSFSDYFLQAEMVESSTSDQDLQYNLKVDFYDTGAREIVFSEVFPMQSLFETIDDLSDLIRTNIGLPNTVLRATQDFTIAELLTGNEKALDYLGAGLLAYTKRDFSTAAEKFGAAIIEDNNSAYGYYLLGLSQSTVGDMSLSVESLDEAMKRRYQLPASVEIRLKDTYYQTNGNADKRIGLLQMERELNPDSQAVLNRLSDAYMNSEEYGKAIEVYRTSQSLSANPALYLLRIGLAFLRSNDSSNALQAFTEYLQLYPDSTTSLVFLAQTHRVRGNMELAGTALQQALFIDPYDKSATIALLDLDIAEGHFTKVGTRFEQLIADIKEPEYLSALYFTQADYYHTRGQMDKALMSARQQLNAAARYRSAINLAGDKTSAMTYFIEAGERVEAFEILTALENSIEPPYDGITSFGYLYSYLAEENVSLSREWLPKVQAFMEFNNASSNSGTSQRGQMLETLGFLDELEGKYYSAATYYKEYIDVSPMAFDRHLSLGRVYRKTGKWKEAEELLLRTLNLVAYQPEAHYELALVYQGLNDKERALDHLRTSLSIWENADPDYDNAVAARELMRELEADSELATEKE